MKTREITLVSLLSTVAVAIGYLKGLTITSFPGLIEFMTVTIFVTGFCFGCSIGALTGALTLAIYMLIPYPFAHPAAWIFTISPILLSVMIVLGALYGFVGGLLGRHWNPDKKSSFFVLEMAFWGFILTLLYDIFSSVGFYLAYPVYPSVWEAIYFTFIPLYYVYPPIIHTITNTIVFALIAPPLIRAIKVLTTPHEKEGVAKPSVS